MNDALKLLEHFERASCEDPLTAHLNAYNILAIGWGHTEGVCDGQTITREQADDLAISDLTRIEIEINKLLMPSAREEINGNMMQALASFAHSIGVHLFKQTTVLARLNSRRYSEVPKEMAKLNHYEGRELRSLTRRRASEGALFCSLPNWLATK